MFDDVQQTENSILNGKDALIGCIRKYSKALKLVFLVTPAYKMSRTEKIQNSRDYLRKRYYDVKLTLMSNSVGKVAKFLQDISKVD